MSPSSICDSSMWSRICCFVFVESQPTIFGQNKPVFEQCFLCWKGWHVACCDWTCFPALTVAFCLLVWGFPAKHFSLFSVTPWHTIFHWDFAIACLEIISCWLLEIHCGGNDWGKTPHDCDWRETKLNDCGSHNSMICPRNDTLHWELGQRPPFANTNCWIIQHGQAELHHQKETHSIEGVRWQQTQRNSPTRQLATNNGIDRQVQKWQDSANHKWCKWWDIPQWKKNN